MFDELRRLGFIEGKNLTIDWRTYGPRTDLVSEFEALVKTQPDVIYAAGFAGLRAAQKATTTIPILGFYDDMVGSGLVNSLARPNGNTTGVSLLAAAAHGQFPAERLPESSSLKPVGRPSNLTFRWIRFPRWVGVMCPTPTEPALDTLYRSVDHARWEELGRRHGRCGLAAGPWPWTV